MRRSKHRICLGCSQPFIGRVDAKTCSPKCRKRFQRAQELYRAVVEQSRGSVGLERQAAYRLRPTREEYHGR